MVTDTIARLAAAIYGIRVGDVFDAVSLVWRVRKKKQRIFFVGNGGSAAIASHMAADYQKAGKCKAFCFNDGAQLTCLANDLGYGNVFSEPLLMHGAPGDLLVAISSSGKSDSIINAVHAARARDMGVITLSGMKPDNPLSEMGDINFHVRSDRYGVIEIAHLAILHTILDEIPYDQTA